MPTQPEPRGGALGRGQRGVGQGCAATQPCAGVDLRIAPAGQATAAAGGQAAAQAADIAERRSGDAALAFAFAQMPHTSVERDGLTQFHERADLRPGLIADRQATVGIAIFAAHRFDIRFHARRDGVAGVGLDRALAGVERCRRVVELGV